MQRPAEPERVEIPPKMAARLGTGTMLIPTPRLIDGLMRQVPEGKLMTVTQLRAHLAAAHHTNTTCPLTTGIFLRIAAEAALEQMRAGTAGVTPCWRVVREDGTLLDKFPGGPEAQAAFLVAEGHTILPGRGKGLPRVANAGAQLVAGQEPGSAAAAASTPA